MGEFVNNKGGGGGLGSDPSANYEDKDWINRFLANNHVSPSYEIQTALLLMCSNRFYTFNSKYLKIDIFIASVLWYLFRLPFNIYFNRPFHSSNETAFEVDCSILPWRIRIFCFLLLSYSLKHLVAIGGIQLLPSDLEGRRVSLSKYDLGEGEGVLCQCGRLPINF